jgi:hypothetical protein
MWAVSLRKSGISPASMRFLAFLRARAKDGAFRRQFPVKSGDKFHRFSG